MVAADQTGSSSSVVMSRTSPHSDGGGWCGSRDLMDTSSLSRRSRRNTSRNDDKDVGHRHAHAVARPSNSRAIAICVFSSSAMARLQCRGIPPPRWEARCCACARSCARRVPRTRHHAGQASGDGLLPHVDQTSSPRRLRLPTLASGFQAHTVATPTAGSPAVAAAVFKLLSAVHGEVAPLLISDGPPLGASIA